MEIVLALAALVAGVGLAVQAGINSAMARHAARAEFAAIVNFGVGLVALVAWAVASRMRWPSAATLAEAPAWAWAGGLIGAFYVTAAVLIVPRLGLALTLGLSVAGQLVGALLLDRIGAFGLAARPLTPSRVAGVALLVVALVLIRRT
jgi:transporter family-2 protein